MLQQVKIINRLLEPAIISQFLSCHISEKTKRARSGDIYQFLDFVDLNLDDIVGREPGEIYNMANSFRNAIMKYDEFSDYISNATTVARKISSLKIFFEYLVKLGYFSKNPVSQIKSPSVPTESTSNGLTVEEIKLILDVIDTHSLIGKRDYLIINLIFYCGLRRSEVANLRIGNLLKRGEYYIVKITGKRNKIREIPLKKHLVDLINEHLFGMKLSFTEKGEFLFCSYSHRNISKRTKISDQTIYNIVKKYALKAGIEKNISPHSFRHSAVTVALDNGATYREVMNLTGHSDTRLVMRYDRGDRLKNNGAWKIPFVA